MEGHRTLRLPQRSYQQVKNANSAVLILEYRPTNEQNETLFGGVHVHKRGTVPVVLPLWWERGFIPGCPLSRDSQLPPRPQPPVQMVHGVPVTQHSFCNARHQLGIFGAVSPWLGGYPRHLIKETRDAV